MSTKAELQKFFQGPRASAVSFSVVGAGSFTNVGDKVVRHSSATFNGIVAGSLSNVGSQLTRDSILGPQQIWFLCFELNDRCPLSCKHCVYSRHGDGGRVVTKSALTHEGLMRFLATATIPPQWVSFAGMEPATFIREYPREFVELTAALESSHRIVMTSGLMLDQQMWIAEHINLLDVSLDGDEETHDKNRGPGTFKRTFRNIQAAAKVFPRIGAIATATRETLEGIPKLQHLMADTFDPAVVGLTISLYYSDKLDDPLTPSFEELAELFVTLSRVNFPVRVLWTPDYSHLTDRLFETIEATNWGYDKPTLLPVVESGSLKFIVFNLVPHALPFLRVGVDGNVFLGCSHLTFPGDVSAFAVGDARTDSIPEILDRVSRQAKITWVRDLYEIPEVCRDRECTSLCRGGDLLTGTYLALRGERAHAIDPRCALIN